ncbi:MAG: class I SAM-dependent methyltransferase [Actinomycetota bacterium]|nr:class I SAM-dependent methyltransferase [Actinomycetota bacterium]
MGTASNRWRLDEHASAWLEMLPSLPHLNEADAALLEWIPERVDRFLDLGTGNGRMIDLVLGVRPASRAVGLDFSPVMIDAARRRFADDGRVEIREHDLDEPLPPLGPFDAVVSGLAIHHCPDERKRDVYAEAYGLLRPGGVFLNLDHVASPTLRLHEKFLAALDMAPEDDDPSNILLDVETQLRWLREVGFTDVDCYWKWREVALLGGVRPE